MKTVVTIPIIKSESNLYKEANDLLAVEEPLEIRLNYFENGVRITKGVSVTMRTPTMDKELAIGFLFTEGILKSDSDVQSVHSPDENIIEVFLEESCKFNFQGLDRNFYTTSSCGVCGKASIEAIHTAGIQYPKTENIHYSSSLITGLNEKLRGKQSVFDVTGGLHASALFTPEGEILIVCEDVGRHNALDKLIGTAFLQGMIPLSNNLLFLSGRASFELIQKAKMANIKTVVAVGAPSSLAVQLAISTDMTLIGFLRNNRFNIYSGKERILLDKYTV